MHARQLKLFFRKMSPLWIRTHGERCYKLCNGVFGRISISRKSKYGGTLLIEVDGNDENTLHKECETIMDALNPFECGDILYADNNQQKESLWKLRRSVGEAVKAQSIYKEEDTVVPRAHLAELIIAVKEIGLKFGFQVFAMAMQVMEISI